MSERSPWGETYDELAEAVLADKNAPPVLALAAFLHRQGEPTRLRGLVADAVALDACDCEAPRCQREGCQDRPTAPDRPAAVSAGEGAKE